MLGTKKMPQDLEYNHFSQREKNCKFKIVGCEFTSSQGLMAGHLKNNHEEHLSMLMDDYITVKQELELAQTKLKKYESDDKSSNQKVQPVLEWKLEMKKQDEETKQIHSLTQNIPEMELTMKKQQQEHLDIQQFEKKMKKQDGETKEDHSHTQKISEMELKMKKVKIPGEATKQIHSLSQQQSRLPQNKVEVFSMPSTGYVPVTVLPSGQQQHLDIQQFEKKLNGIVQRLEALDNRNSEIELHQERLEKKTADTELALTKIYDAIPNVSSLKLCQIEDFSAKADELDSKFEDFKSYFTQWGVSVQDHSSLKHCQIEDFSTKFDKLKSEFEHFRSYFTQWRFSFQGHSSLNLCQVEGFCAEVKQMKVEMADVKQKIKDVMNEMKKYFNFKEAAGIGIVEKQAFS